jgi:hypothetical protein
MSPSLARDSRQYRPDPTHSHQRRRLPTISCTTAIEPLHAARKMSRGKVLEGYPQGSPRLVDHLPRVLTARFSFWYLRKVLRRTKQTEAAATC